MDKVRKDLYCRMIKRRLGSLPSASVIKNIFQYKFELITRKKIVTASPLSLVLYLNKRCNLSCVFCYNKDVLNKSDMNTSDMNLKEFTNIMNTSYGKRALRVGLMGGEPFLNKEIFDFIADLGLRRKVSNVVSNATPLKGEMLERLIKSSIDVVGLSLYENNFDDVARVVSALNRSNKSYWVQTVAERQDLLMLEKRIKFCREIKCRNLIISNYNSFFDKKHEAVIFDDDLEYIKWEKHFLKEQIHPMNIQWPKKIKRTNPISKDCKMLLSYMHIDNKGLIGPCCFRYPEKKYGNIFVKDSWNGEELVRLRMKMMDKVSSPCEICLGCENLSDDLYGL